MISVILKNGNTINIDATEVEYSQKEQMIRVGDDDTYVARFNMNNIAGWVDTDYEIESEE